MTVQDNAMTIILHSRTWHGTLVLLVHTINQEPNVVMGFDGGGSFTLFHLHERHIFRDIEVEEIELINIVNIKILLSKPRKRTIANTSWIG